LNRLNLIRSESRPDVALNRHCTKCEYNIRCLQEAIVKDDLSLLAGMTEKERKKLNSKGIFTVTQFSYTFRPRRRPRRLRDKKEKYYHSLKALAIREKKIHVIGSPELKTEGTPVFIDVEGIPDKDFFYLIGLRIKNFDKYVQQSFWANSISEEFDIFISFLKTLSKVENPQLFHYGRYETVFLKQMKERYSEAIENTEFLDRLINQSVNLLSVVYAQIYFPTYSNGLTQIFNSCKKDILRY
jgi:predicted RecB family nuclease